MKTNSTHGLKPENLFKLLSIGADKDLFCNELINSNEDIKSFFQHLLHRKIPKESSIVDSILIYLRESKVFGETLIGLSLWDILSDPQTTLELLQTIKNYSKKIYQSTYSKGENSIALAIYYAAIASGIVYHNTKITEHSYQILRDAFSNLSKQPWITAEIEQLFFQANDICQIKSSHHGQ